MTFQGQPVDQPDDYRTPGEKLTLLPRWNGFLKPGVTAQVLDRLAHQLSDTEAALPMQSAKLAMRSATRSSRESFSEPYIFPGFSGASVLKHRPALHSSTGQIHTAGTVCRTSPPSYGNSGASRAGIKSVFQALFWVENVGLDNEFALQ